MAFENYLKLCAIRTIVIWILVVLYYHMQAHQHRIFCFCRCCFCCVMVLSFSPCFKISFVFLTFVEHIHTFTHTCMHAWIENSNLNRIAQSLCSSWTVSVCLSIWYFFLLSFRFSLCNILCLEALRLCALNACTFCKCVCMCIYIGFVTTFVYLYRCLTVCEYVSVSAYVCVYIVCAMP